MITYSVGLVQPAEFRAIRGVRTMEFRWAVVAALGVLVLGTLKGIVVAIVVSMIGLASQVADPRVYEADKRASERGAVVWLAGLNPGVLEVVRHAGLDERLGRDRMLFNARAAIAKFQAMRPPQPAPVPA